MIESMCSRRQALKPMKIVALFDRHSDGESANYPEHCVLLPYEMAFPIKQSGACSFQSQVAVVVVL